MIYINNIAIDSSKIKEIFNQTLSAIDSSKHQIFDIAENVRTEYNSLKKELQDAQSKLLLTMSEVNMFEKEVELGRQKLYEVNKNYDKYSEEIVEQVYDKVNNLVIALAEKREEEKNIIQLRNSLEQRLKTYSKVIEDTEKIISQISVAMNFLEGNLTDVIKNIDDINKKSFLGIQIIEALEAERERIARDIHDGPAQSFSNISLSIELIKKLIESNKDQAILELDEIKKNAKDNLTDIRKIIYDLKPFNISENGLMECINILVASLKESSNVSVNLKNLSPITLKNDLIIITVFRMLREVMNNIKKYAHASTVDIVLEQTSSFLNITVSDDGVGFDTTHMQIDQEHGFGLASIKRQCKYLQANFDITSSPSKGTKVSIKIPLEI